MSPANSMPAAFTISRTGSTARSVSPAATILFASVPRGVILTLTLSAMPSRGKRSVLSQMPLVLPGTATVFALSRTCLKASTVLTSGFGVPARTATPRGTRARSTSVPATIFFAAISSLRPSRERITTLAGTPRASCVAIVCGPVPCDAPDPVVTLMRVVRSNSGSSCSYAPLNPPEIRTFNCCADAAAGPSRMAKITTEKVFIMGSSPARSCVRRNYRSCPRHHPSTHQRGYAHWSSGLTNRSTSRSEGGPPRTDQLTGGKDDHARNEEKKYRDCQIGMLLEFPDTFIQPRRSPKKDRAYEQENRDGGGQERHDFEDHRCSHCRLSGTPPRSLHLQIEALDQGRPLSLFNVDLGGIFRGRAGRRLGAFAQHSLPHLLGHHGGAQFARQPLDDRGRRAGGCREPVANGGGETRYRRFGNRRYIGQKRGAVRRRDRQREQLAGFDLTQDRRERQHHHRDMAADEIADRLAVALIGDTSEFDPCAADEHLGCHVADGARYEAIVDLAGIGLGVGNQLGGRARRQRRMHREHARLPADQPDRGEVLARIVAGVGIERRIDIERTGIGEQDGVAIGRALGDRPRRDGAAGAAAVLHYDLMTEPAGHLLGNDARQRIVAAAGGKGHHQHDRTCGIVLRCDRRRGGENRCERRSRDGKTAVHHSPLALN